MFMEIRLRTGVRNLTIVASMLFAGHANAQMSDNAIRIGVLTDLSGLAADIAGKGSVEAARLAAQQMGNSINGVPIEIVDADTQNKPDIGSGIARRWFGQEKVDIIVDLPVSSVALAVQNVAREQNKIVLYSGAGSDALTGEQCAPLSVVWSFNGYALGNVLASSIMKEGDDTWFFITSDYAGGHALEKGARTIVEALNGKVLGAVRHPLNNSDYSSFLLQAKASGAKVIALANSGNDAVNTIKQAQEFNLSDKQRVVALLLFISDIHSLGLQAAKNLFVSTAFYWDLNDKSRAWSQEFMKRTGRMPTFVQAGVGSAVGHYLKGVKATGTDDAATVMAWMKKNPVDDFFSQGGIIRQDGQMVHDMYLAKVKTPAESKQTWDYLNVVQTVPGSQAFLPIERSTCPLVVKK